MLKVTAALDFARPSALLDGATKKAAARIVSAMEAVKGILFTIVTSFGG
jgi:hypothetical protein